MIKTLSMLCLLFWGFYVKAQYPGYVLLNPPETFKNAFARATAATESIQSDFSQEKTLAMLSEKINSTGKFWYKKTNKLRMEYVRPYTYLMILNAGKIFIKEGQKESKVSAKSNKVFQQVIRILIDCVGDNMLDNPDFQSSVFESKGSFLVELKPLTKN